MAALRARCTINHEYDNLIIETVAALDEIAGCEVCYVIYSLLDCFYPKCFLKAHTEKDVLEWNKDENEPDLTETEDEDEADEIIETLPKVSNSAGGD